MRLLVLALLALLAATPAFAQDDGGYSQLPALKADALDDNAPIRMSPDGPAVIQLNQDAASVIVGNPAQATAILENPRLIMLMPQQPGATKIIALDKDGKALLNKHVLVGGGKSGFIRINKPCGSTTNNANCRPVAMYYCPDRCYETSVPQPGSDVPDAAPAAPAPVPAAPAQQDVPAPTPGSNEITVDEGAE